MLTLEMWNTVLSKGGASSVMMEMCLSYPLMYIHLLFPPVAGTFSCTMKFTVRDCDPNTGVPDEDGYDDEYVVSLPSDPVPLQH